MCGGVRGLAAGVGILADHQHPAIGGQLADGRVEKVVQGPQILRGFQAGGIKHQGGKLTFTVGAHLKRLGLVAGLGRFRQGVRAGGVEQVGRAGAKNRAEGCDGFGAVTGTNQHVTFKKGLVHTLQAFQRSRRGQAKGLGGRFADRGIYNFQVEVRHGFFLVDAVECNLG